jgi:hypothetical protein
MSFLLAAVLLTTSRGVVVADANRVELHDRGAVVWSVDGVAQPTKLIAGDGKIAVLDALNNEARVIDLRNGASTITKTADTPVDAEFNGGALRILERGRNDAAFRKDGLTYFRGTGVLDVRGRSVAVAPYASDLETDGRTAYLVFPREAKVRTVDLKTLAVGEIVVGAVPVDLAISGRMLAVADPAARRVWMIEGVQSMTEAETRGRRCVAFDSATSTLYSVEGKVLARNAEFALTDEGVAIYSGGRLTALRLH